RLARRDRRDRRPRLPIPESDLDRPLLGFEPDGVLTLGEPDPQVVRRALLARDARTRVEVLEDLRRPPPLLGDAVRAPLRQPETVPEPRTEQPELLGAFGSTRLELGSGARRGRGERHREQQGKDEESSHRRKGSVRMVERFRTVSQRSEGTEGYGSIRSPGRTRPSRTEAPAPTTTPSPSTESLTEAPRITVEPGPRIDRSTTAWGSTIARSCRTESRTCAPASIVAFGPTTTWSFTVAPPSIR